jgi:predicted ATPase
VPAALLRQDGNHDTEAEQRFQEAMELARHQGARMFELRAATSLARLWVRQGKGAAARELLEDTLRQGDPPVVGVDARAAESLVASLS